MRWQKEEVGMEIREPDIEQEEILVLPDPQFTMTNVCIVTGAGSGIGRATALAAAANGLRTVGLDIDEIGGKETQEMAQEMGREVVFVKTDLTLDEEIDRAVREATKLGSIRYVANIAGIQHVDPVERFPMEKYDLMQRVMLRPPFYLPKLCLPQMKKNADGVGVVGTMASIHAHTCTVNKSVYNIMKFGLRGLTQSIAAEGNGKIRSFSVSTGFVKTSLTLNQIPAQAQQRGITHEEVVRDVMMGPSRLKEMMTAIEVANLFVLGFSHYSRYLIGGDLLFDGGVVMTY
jgi:3-hydroxybutyrate dehydrogenase